MLTTRPTARTGALRPLAVALLLLGPSGAIARADTAAVDPTTTASVPAVASSDLSSGPSLAPSSAPSSGGSMEFSSGLSGPWTARGEVLPSLSMERPFRVKCDFTVDSSDRSFDLDGECGALFVKRPVRTALVREGEAITGTYEADLRTGTATLTGRERDGAIEMDVEWGGEVNGDETARMRIVREGDKLRVQTIDIDPATGEEVTTTDLLLERS